MSLSRLFSKSHVDECKHVMSLHKILGNEKFVTFKDRPAKLYIKFSDQNSLTARVKNLIENQFSQNIDFRIADKAQPNTMELMGQIKKTLINEILTSLTKWTQLVGLKGVWLINHNGKLTFNTSSHNYSIYIVGNPCAENINQAQLLNALSKTPLASFFSATQWSEEDHKKNGHFFILDSNSIEEVLTAYNNKIKLEFHNKNQPHP